MPKEEKSTDFEKEQRIDLICEMLIKGLTRSQMIQYVSKKTDWNISDRQVDTYISEAKEKIRNSENDKDFEIKKAKMRLEKLYQKNESIEDYKECRALIDTMAKLFGWIEPKKIEVDQNTNHKIEGFSIKDIITFKENVSDK